MPSLSEIFAYLSKLIRSWWLLVPIVVGVVRLGEWLFRHGKPFPIPPRARWAIAIGGVIVAQFLTYEDVENERRKLSSEKTSLEGQLKTKEKENEALSSANKELSKRLQDAPPSNLSRLKGSQQGRTSGPQDAVITEIARLADRGTEIQNVWLKSDDIDTLKKEYSRWAEEVVNTLNSGAGSSYTVQFKNAHGSAFMGCPSNHGVEGCGYWQEITGKNAMLMNAVTELRQRR